MKRYCIYQEVGVLELVAMIQAESLEEAREKAKKLGYGKEYRIEEDWED